MIRHKATGDPRRSASKEKTQMVQTVLVLILSAIGNTAFAGGQGAVDTSKSPHVKLRSLPMADVKWTDGFWKERFELCADHMIPTMKKAMSGPASAKLGRLEWAAGLRSDNPGGVPWADGDTEALATGHHTAVRWRTNNCYCCPPSVARTTAKIHNWFYNISDDGALWVNFYGGSKLSTTLADGSKIALRQTTDYPWNGRIEINIDVAGAKPLPIRFRIPGWVEHPSVSLNGKPYNGQIEPGTYLEIKRNWSAGDRLVLDFPMPARLIAANRKVKKLHNKVAIMRGPIVHCMELPKQEGGEEVYLNGVLLPENVEFTPEHPADFLGGLTVLKGKALTFEGCEQFVKDNPGADASLATEEGALYQPIQPRNFKIPRKETIDLTLIPYYAWANRGIAYMDVWIPLATKVQLAAQRRVTEKIQQRIAAEKLKKVTIWKDASGWTVVNDSHPAIKYGPGMQSQTIRGRGLIHDDEHFTLTKYSYFEYTFTGTDIVWLGSKGPWRGYADVYIDGKKVAEVNPYSPQPELGVELFRKEGMPHEEHTIRLVCTARKGHPDGKEPYIDLDAFKYR